MYTGAMQWRGEDNFSQERWAWRLPTLLALFLAPNDYDKNGWSISFNNAVQYYNLPLWQKLAYLHRQLEGANIIYLDNYNMVYALMSKASTYGAHCKFDQYTL